MQVGMQMGPRERGECWAPSVVVVGAGEGGMK